MKAKTSSIGREMSSETLSVNMAHSPEHTLAWMSTGAVVAIGAVAGLALGILVSVTTDVPLAPEAGLVLGGLVGWLSLRDAGR
jgi:hypothetical protein